MDIAKLGITITQQGADEAKAKLDALTASGAKAEAQFTSSSAKITQSLTTQTAAVKDAYAAWQKGEASLNDERLLRHEGIIKQSTVDYYALAAAERAATEAQVQQIAAQGSGLYATQAMIKAQADAIAMDARMSQGVQLHGLQLGRLNQEIGTFIGRLTGTNTALTRLTAQVGGAVVGYGSMIAVLGGVALAIAGAEAIYNKFTEASRKAREENERLLKVLDDIAKRRGETEVSTTVAAIAAGQAKLADLQKQLAAAQAFATSTAPRGYAGGGLSVSYGPSPDEALKKVNDLKAKIASAEAELTQLVRQGAADRDRAITSDIANLVKSGQATEKQIANAKALLAGYEQSLTALQKAGSSDTATLVDLADKIKTLNDALYPKQHITAGGVTGPTVEQRAVLDGLEKQLEAMRKVDDENHREDAAARAAAAAVGIQGAQLDILNAKRKAELDTLQAYQQYSGPALTDRLNQIAATEKQSIATANVKQRFEDAKASQDLMASAMKVAEEQAKRNTDATKKWDAETADAIRKQLKYANDLRNIWRQGFANIFTDGLRSATDFFRDVDRLFARLMQRMEQEGKDSGGLYKFLGIGSSAIAGAFAGYGIGQQTGSSGVGVLGGAGVGAITGAQIAGPLGAVVGGLAGAVGGFFGASQAQKEAAERFKAAVEQFKKSAEAFIVGAGGNSTANQLETVKLQYLALKAQADGLAKFYAGIASAFRPGSGPNAGATTVANQFTKQGQDIDTAYAQYVQKISDDFWRGINQQLNALNGPAGEYANALDAINKQYADNVAAIHALHAGDRDLAALQEDLAKVEALRAKQEEQLKAAEAERLRRQQEDLQVRQVRAQGQSQQADLLAFQIAQRRELADAIKNGMDPATLAMLQLVQGLEANVFAEQQLQQAIEQSISDIRRDAQVLGLSPSEAVAREQQAFGFGGLTTDQIKALYTPYSGTALTPEQETLNNNIAQYLQDVQAANATQGGATGGGAGSRATGATAATANAARALSEYTGNRMADYLASIQVHVASLDKGLVGGNGLSSSAASPSAAGLTSADVDKLLLGIQSTTSKPSTPTVQINVAIAPSATESPDAYARRVGDEIAKKVEELLAQQYSDAQIRSGSTLKIGA